MGYCIHLLALEEIKYTYYYSQQITAQTGLIGRLCAKFTSDDMCIMAPWEEYNTSLAVPCFRGELAHLGNALRGDTAIVDLLKLPASQNSARCGTILSSFSALRDFCSTLPKDICGIRVNSETYAYLIRLNPVMGQTNMECFCYRREWLDSHIQHATKGIRFINAAYEVLFRIQDGDLICVTRSNGEKLYKKVRYIDDYHIEVGSTPCTNIYHICEFAERMEAIDAKVTPA